MLRKIKVEMVLMVSVCIGAEGGPENITGFLIHIVQIAAMRPSAPVVFDGHNIAVAQLIPRDVDGHAATMFRNARTRLAVARAT